jgi:hypothetical protein
VAIAVENAAESNLIGLKPTVDSTVRRQFVEFASRSRKVRVAKSGASWVFLSSMAPEKEEVIQVEGIASVILHVCVLNSFFILFCSTGFSCMHAPPPGRHIVN